MEFVCINGGWMMELITCMVYWALLGIASFLIGRILPKSWFHADHFPYKTFRWEKNGRIYNKLHIRKWQNHVPDMSKVFPHLMLEKKMTTNYLQDLPLMIQETCIAEFIHFILCFAGLYCLRLWPGIGGVIMTILYIVLGNIPYILIQRYNRPRLFKLLEKAAKTKPEREKEAAYGNVDINVQYRSGT